MSKVPFAASLTRWSILSSSARSNRQTLPTCRCIPRRTLQQLDRILDIGTALRKKKGRCFGTGMPRSAGGISSSSSPAFGSRKNPVTSTSLARLNSLRLAQACYGWSWLSQRRKLDVNDHEKRLVAGGLSSGQRHGHDISSCCSRTLTKLCLPRIHRSLSVGLPSSLKKNGGQFDSILRRIPSRESHNVGKR